MVSGQQSPTSPEEEHEKMGKWCCGRLNAMYWLLSVALATLLSDLGCAFLMLGDLLAGYYFVCSSIVSLLCVGAVVSGVQEERRWLVQFSSVVSALKSLLLATLFTITAVGAMGTNVNSRGVDYVMPEGNPKLLLLVCLPLLIGLALLQWRLSYRVARWIEIRDELYIIPAYYPDKEVKKDSSVFDYQRMWRWQQEVPVSSSSEKF